MRGAVPLVVAVLLGLGALVLIEQGTRQQAWLVGGLLVLTGLPLLGLARWHIGKAFAITPQAKGLVTRGLYSRIPHPMYTFLDVALLGVVVALRFAWLLVPWLALVGVHAWTARREARVLERAFGDAYREYRTHTWW
jgi:protein-S-isoprenylcysteine O-methyltransferase Ste14